MNHFRWTTAALLALVVVLCLAGDVSACPTCKDGLAENDPSSQAMAAGYFYSILFMMAVTRKIIDMERLGPTGGGPQPPAGPNGAPSTS